MAVHTKEVQSAAIDVSAQQWTACEHTSVEDPHAAAGGGLAAVGIAAGAAEFAAGAAAGAAAAAAAVAETAAEIAAVAAAVAVSTRQQ